MSHPNPSGNGCSLEDCLTNLFALTDLCGIKWRRLVSENVHVETLDDPVLIGFSRCMNLDILCVWRRVQRDPEQRQPDFNSTKELWIFWYGDEPESLRQALSPDLGLKEVESGTWDRDKDKDNGLTYECRTLLFKALHNLIDRNLLLKNFVRLGRWYVLPYEHGSGENGVHLSFCFNYFLHGESQVCASIEVKLRPPVWRLTNQHIALVQDNQASIQVILAPFGLCGTLTGVTYPDNDHSSSTARMFAEWANYYPIKETSREESCGGAKVPNMVEVIVGGTHMKYPTCYVLVCDNEDLNGSNSVLQPLQPPAHATPHGRPLTRSLSQFSPPASPCEPGFGLEQHGIKISPLAGSVLGQPDTMPSINTSKAEVLGYQLAEKVRQDACIHVASNKRLSDVTASSEEQQQPASVGAWNFTDPVSKVTCNCVRHRKKTQGKNAVGGKHGKGDKFEKLDRQLSRLSRNSVPFHRRGPQVDDMLQFDVDPMMSQQNMQQQQPNPAFCPTGGTTVNSSALPQGRSSTPMHENVVSMDTPNSAPSPLDEPQPLPSSSMDPTMPTLSPHPPSKFSQDINGGRSGGGVIAGAAGCNAASDLTHIAAAAVTVADGTSFVPAGGGVGGSSVNCDTNLNLLVGSGNSAPAILTGNSSSNNNVLNNGVAHSGTSVVTCLVDKTIEDTNLPAAIKPSASAPSSDPHPQQQFSWSLVTSKSESVSHWVNSHQQRPTYDKQHERMFDINLKRPSLPTKGSDSDSEQGVDSLYDFEAVNMWIDMPLKKGRFEPLDEGLSEDLLAPSSSFASHSRPSMMASPSPPDPDPYEFSDEASKDPKTLTTRSRPSRDDSMARPSPLDRMEDDSRPSSRQGTTELTIKDEPPSDLGQLSSPLTPGGSLTREQDIRVMGTYQDLHKIFQSDSSEDDEDGGAVDSGLGSKSTDDLKPIRMQNGSLSSIAPLDLGRMYPTPPSHETNKSHSPETMTDGTNEGILTSTSIVAFHSTVEAAVQPIDVPITSVKCDVFIPPVIAEAVGAAKYSPLELPSDRSSPLPNVPEYKPNWSFAMPIMDSQHSHRMSYVNLPSVENISSIRTVGSGAGIDASPAIYSNSQQRTPLSLELHSPASNSSSYLNKTNNSIDNHGTNTQLPEANSLLLNVLLCDSILNLFKDHNFDSCTICVCNADINGSDVSVYLPDTSKGSSSGLKCTCAFSAAVNRRFGYDSGLFYEEELEITGLRHDRYDHRKPSLLQQELMKSIGDSLHRLEDINPQIMYFLLSQYSSPFLSCLGSQHLNYLHMASDTTYQLTSVDLLQIRDANEVVFQALEVARQAMDHCLSSRFEEHLLKTNCMHKWPYLRGASCVPTNSQDIIQCLKSLHPILQNAIQNKRVTRMWENTYKLQGPISWKDFHDLAGRGTEENHEPQPIPNLLVGHDRDWLSVSPYGVRFWEKQFLEPYGRMRDVLYVVVAPESDFLLQHIVSFFKELSTVYELCRLGRHCAIKPLRDGVLRVGKQVAAKLSNEPVGEWFSTLGDSHIASKLKLYAQVCKYNLAPILCQPNLDKSMFEQGSNTTHNKAQFKMPEPAVNCTRPATPDSQPVSNSAQPPGAGQGTQATDDTKDGGQSDGVSQQREGPHEGSDSHGEESNPDAPGIVVYIVDPFSYGQGGEGLSRLAVIGLLKCFQEMALPEHLANIVSLQLIPLQVIMEHKENALRSQALKSIAFSVFTSSRWNLTHTILGRSLTGFGPAAAAEVILKKKEEDSRKREEDLKLYSPPFVLASTKSRQNQIMEARTEQQTILFCGYCLSEDQRWLLAVCTDEKGELMECCTINIEIPNRNRRKKASARRPGLQKLWDFILGVVSMGCFPTRLVIGRFGRMGHGELKGWSGLLNKKNLQSASHRLKTMCQQCSVMGTSDVPCVLSACLTSIETHPSFQVIVDAMKQEEKVSSSIPLQTPRDASVTHILVFPTSATAQVNANPLQQDPQNDFTAHLELDDVFTENLMGDDMFLEIFGDNFDAPTTSPPGSPVSSAHRQNSRISGGPSASLGESLADPQDDVNLLQQPLAMGYFISTAPPGPLPKWFWSACPENEFVSPHVFKSALHIHESSRHDDFLHKTDNRSKPHALDSHMTCDILRYVLETYNSLSWLTFDPVLNDRRSCLPVHLVVLMQMYHALNTFV